ncbi:MAG: GNAT family N-acetyltransferase [Hyphomicrobiales bacterium]|nr:GNAT family N-acetyltransferase [Hyphomicrobiales bacterium]
MALSQFESLFNPKSIAVFGASESGDSVGSMVFSNILAGGFKGAVVPVNPKYENVRGHTCYPAAGDVPDRIDLAVIATPAPTVARIIQDCGAAGIRNAIVISAGFGETGDDGRRLETELAETARKSGVRFLGPNCVGLVRPALGLNATFLTSTPPDGRLALVSQSGALISAIADWAVPHHLGCSALVSLGNSANIGFGDTINFLANDPHTEAILLYIEGIRNARSFVSALRYATRIKPVIVLKAGRHAQGSRAAHTHTGAMMGSDAVFDAALERAGAVRARSFGELFAAAEVLSAGARAKGRRLCVITNGGGAGVLAADRAGDLHIELPAPSTATIEALDKLLPPHWSHGNPVDILGDAGAKVYGAAIRACLADRNFDGLMVALTPQSMTDPTAVARALLDARPERPEKPLLACWMGETAVAGGRKLLSSNGVPDFTTPEQAVEAFSYIYRHSLNRQLALETPGPLSQSQPPDIAGARLIIETALAQGRDSLSSVEAKAVLRAFHIPTNITIEAGTAANAVVAAETVGFPVAIKINAPQITHKSDVGGVVTDLMNAADVRISFDDMVERAKRQRPDATISGVTVEPMARLADTRELVVGVSTDPVFGPAILFGAGGTMVEILRDNAVSLPPLNEVLARRLIDRTRVSRLLDAFRERPPVDRQAVVAVLTRISDLVCELPEISELDINPLIAGPDGVLAVDARIAIHRPAPGRKLYDHIAIAPYPRHLEQRMTLSDGTRMTVRPIRPEDAQSEQTFVRGLSQEAKKFRFMHSLNELSPQMLEQFTQIDYSREMALVAITEETGGPVQQGVARYITNPDERSCEFAIVVSDKRQNQGIGTRLMETLMDIARGNGLQIIQGDVLAENHGMLHLMKDLGFSISRSPEEREIYRVERGL